MLHPFPDHVRLVGRIDDLATIRLPAVNLAIWQRDGTPVVDDLDTVDDVAVTLMVDALSDGLPEALRAAGYADAALGRDIVDLATQFAALMESAAVAIRLEVIETDACRKFHADYVTARLICSYVGPGTQWLDTGDAAALAGGSDPATLTLRQVATGDVALFKGRGWSEDAPIVHRSPPVAATGERRLVLVIDPRDP
ncbi:DUF1826 domain-containing protein [Sphingomonas hankookensis]|uniref:DUF1826 domain-containing protein n=1 Tax=Sphingomonas hankookensis TaxID=563996 RepID=UPI001F575AED|nr:DUF1826 domain-containing protein [Sphingomonas hankookensis]